LAAGTHITLALFAHALLAVIRADGKDIEATLKAIRFS
jgi:hypothetical protein